MPELTMEYISHYYHLPISEAAEDMNICETILKRFCRTNGISRWPHRKIRSLDNIIEQLHIKLKDTSNQKDCERIKNEIGEYEKKKQMVLANPNISFASIVTKSTLQSFSKAKLKNIKNRAYYGERTEKGKSEDKAVAAKMISAIIHSPKASDPSISPDQPHLHIPRHSPSPPPNTLHLDQKIDIGSHNNNNNNNNENNENKDSKVERESIQKEDVSDIITGTPPVFSFPTTFIPFEINNNNNKNNKNNKNNNNNNNNNINHSNNHVNKKRTFDDYQKEDTNGTDEFAKFKSSLPAVKYQRIWGTDNSLPLYYSILI